MLIKEDNYNNLYTLRLDDDCILEKSYIEKLLEGIKKGFDMMSGVVPLFGHPSIERENRFVRPIICLHKLDKEGNITIRNDDLGFCYLESEILPCMQVRTNALYKSELNKIIKYPSILSQTGFREELWISFQAILNNYKIGANLGAKAWHLQCPVGGVKTQNYVQNVALDENTTNKWVKKMFEENGNFLQKYYDKVIK